MHKTYKRRSKAVRSLYSFVLLGTLTLWSRGWYIMNPCHPNKRVYCVYRKGLDLKKHNACIINRYGDGMLDIDISPNALHPETFYINGKFCKSIKELKDSAYREI